MATADVGPKYFLRAIELHQKLRFEKNPTVRAEIIAEAQLNATLALIAVTIESGLDAKQMHHYTTHGFRKFD